MGLGRRGSRRDEKFNNTRVDGILLLMEHLTDLGFLHSICVVLGSHLISSLVWLV